MIVVTKILQQNFCKKFCKNTKEAFSPIPNIFLKYITFLKDYSLNVFVV